MKKRKKKQAPLETVETPSFTDPQGSWTGVPLDPTELPVQDADDLYESKAAETAVSAANAMLFEMPCCWTGATALFPGDFSKNGCVTRHIVV